MSAYPLRVFGDPVLKQRAREVEDVSPELVTLVNGMYETMVVENGVGLAAPQVGIRKRIFTYDLHEGEGPHVVLNPEIVESAGETVFLDEGCLSVPGLRFEIVRAERVTMRGVDLDGNEVILAGDDDLVAQLIQHEVDHLDGVLLLDRLDPDVRRAALRELRTRDLPVLRSGTEPVLRSGAESASASGGRGL
jgi:peptide deformylase